MRATLAAAPNRCCLTAPLLWGGALAPGTCRIRRHPRRRAEPLLPHCASAALNRRVGWGARARYVPHPPLPRASRPRHSAGTFKPRPPARAAQPQRAAKSCPPHARLARPPPDGLPFVRVIHAYACATRTRCGGGHAYAGPPRTWWQVWAVHPVCSTLSTAGGARPTLVQDSIAVWAPHPHVTLSRAGGSRPTLAQDSSGVGAPPARDHCLPDTLAVTRVECLPAPPLLAVWAA